MLCLGLSQSFLAVVASRSIAGVLDGNVGVLKAMVGELTDDTNSAQGFTVILMAWSTGATIASVHSSEPEYPYS